MNNIAYLYTGKRYQNCLIDNVVQEGKIIRGILPTKRGKLKQVVFSTKSRNIELIIVPRYYF
jgi:hypothetical protein